MRTLKYSILLATALLIACSDDNPVEGSRDNTIGNTESRGQGQLAAAQEHDTIPLGMQRAIGGG